MKFSVVTISFNQAEFLERAILSVLSQDHDVEFIVVDPGSTDGSRDIIERYRHAIAHVIYEKDDGPADGLNRGFLKAKGDIYCYLNSDDVFEPDAFSKAELFFEGNPDADVICGHAWATDAQDNHLRRIWSDPYRRLPVAYGASVQIQPSTFIRRKAFLKSGGFRVDNRSNWDAELLVDLFETGASIEIVDEILSSYRLHATSITSTGKLHDLIQLWDERRFERLMKRKPQPFDRYIGLLLRAYKHLAHPQAFLERLRHGPLYRSGTAR